jgi:type III secretion protein L
MAHSTIPPQAAELPKSPTRKIVRAADQQAWQDGFGFLEEATRVYASEKERGYREGKLAGASEASVLVAEAAASVDRYLASLDKQMAALALDVVRRILGQFDNHELVARAATAALADFRRDRALKLTVHPSNEAHVRNYLNGRLVRPDLTVTVETDPSFGPTACVVASEFATVNAGIDTQLEAIARAFGLSDAKSAP